MSNVMLSDLSKSFQLRRDTVRVRTELDRATQELSSGRKADLGRSLNGNYSKLVDIDRQLSSLSAFRANSNEASLLANSAQRALTNMREVAQGPGQDLIAVQNAGGPAVVEVGAMQARGAFDLTISALNATVAGRSIFAGAATDRAATASAGEILDELRTLVAAETTAAGVEAIVNAWFDPGGGFDTLGYQGSTETISEFRIADGRSAEFSFKADDTAFRDQLKGLAMGALLTEAPLADRTEVNRLAATAGEAILSNGAAMLAVASQVGTLQARVEAADVQNAAEKTALQMARSDIVSIDQYEVATELQNLQVQLETIYTITARLSRLSLTNFLQ